eukprot:7383308-Prymnesium_polylepis.1
MLAGAKECDETGASVLGAKRDISSVAGKDGLDTQRPRGRFDHLELVAASVNEIAAIGNDCELDVLAEPGNYTSVDGRACCPEYARGLVRPRFTEVELVQAVGRELERRS